MTSAGGAGAAGLTSLIRKEGGVQPKNRIRFTHLFFCFSFSRQTSLHFAETEKPRTIVRGFLAVGVAGFEPTTSSSRTKRATGLRYTPVLNAESAAQNFQAANL